MSMTMKQVERAKRLSVARKLDLAEGHEEPLEDGESELIAEAEDERDFQECERGEAIRRGE